MKPPRRSRDLYTIYRAETVLRETDVTELGTSWGHFIYQG